MRRPPASPSRVQLANGFVLDVNALAVTVEHHDEFCGAVTGCASVRGHRGEFGSLAGLDMVSRSPSSSRTRPSMTKNQSLPGCIRCSGIRSVGSSRILTAIVVPVARPSIQVVRTPEPVWHGTDHHIVVAAHLKQGVEADLEGACQRKQDIGAYRPLARLDPTDGGCTELARAASSSSDRPIVGRRLREPSAHHLLDLVQLCHRTRPPTQPCEYRKPACSRLVGPYRGIHE